MAEEKIIALFDVCQLTYSELRSFGDEFASVFSVVTFALNEVNVFARLLAFSQPYGFEDKDVQVAEVLQVSTMLRTWSAKLFELLKFLGAENGAKKLKLNDRNLESTLQGFRDNYSSIRVDELANLMRSLRHESAFHFPLPAAIRNLNHVSQDAKLTLHFHENVRNNFSALGDELMFVGRVNRQFASSGNDEEQREKFREWIVWTGKVHTMVTELQLKLFDETIAARFPCRLEKKKQYSIPVEKTGLVGSSSVPLFIRSDDK